MIVSLCLIKTVVKSIQYFSVMNNGGKQSQIFIFQMLYLFYQYSHNSWGRWCWLYSIVQMLFAL